MYSAGPISLLSGLNPRPSVLVAHFFMVALYGVGRLLLPRPSIKNVWASVMLIYTAVCIILPIIRSEGIVAVFFPYLSRKPTPDAQMKRIASQVQMNLLSHHSKPT